MTRRLVKNLNLIRPPKHAVKATVCRLQATAVQLSAGYCCCSATVCRLHLLQCNCLQPTAAELQLSAGYTCCSAHVCMLQLLQWNSLHATAAAVQLSAGYSCCSATVCMPQLLQCNSVSQLQLLAVQNLVFHYTKLSMLA